VERSGGHELVVKAAMQQLVVLHTEIGENEVRFDLDGLVYDSPLCRVFKGTLPSLSFSLYSKYLFLELFI
jgi:hypothetical protein